MSLDYEKLFDQAIEGAAKLVDQIPDTKEKAMILTNIATAIATSGYLYDKEVFSNCTEEELASTSSKNKKTKDSKSSETQKDKQNTPTKKQEKEESVPAEPLAIEDVWSETMQKKFADELSKLLELFQGAKLEDILQFIEEATDGQYKASSVTEIKSFDDIECVEDLIKINIRPNNILLLISYAELKMEQE